MSHSYTAWSFAGRPSSNPNNSPIISFRIATNPDDDFQVTSMQSQHLGLPYSPSVPHLPPLKPGAILHLVTIKQPLEPILLWRELLFNDFRRTWNCSPLLPWSRLSWPGWTRPPQILIIHVHLLIIVITSSLSYSSRANNSIDINNDYDHLQDVPTTFSNEKPGQPNPWKYGQSFQVPWPNNFTTSPWSNLFPGALIVEVF